MRASPEPGRVRAAERPGGFTLMELLAVLLIAAVVAGLAAPRIGRMLASARVDRAAATVAGDLRLAEALAARERRAAVFQINSLGGYAVVDRVTSAVLASRSLPADFGLSSVSATPSQVTLFAGGVASSPLTLTLTAGSSTRTVRLTRAGLVTVQ